MTYTIEKYGADWCHGCKVMDKILPKVVEANKGMLVYKSVDLDALPEDERSALTETYGKTIPIVLLKAGDGRVVASQVGAKSIGQMSKFVAAAIELDI